MISAFDFYVDISDENSKFLFRVVIFIQTFLGWYQSSGGNDVIDTGSRDRKRWHVCWRLSSALLIMTLLPCNDRPAYWMYASTLKFYLIFVMRPNLSCASTSLNCRSAAELLPIPSLYSGHGTGTRSTGRVAAGDDNNTQTARNPPQIWYPLLSSLCSAQCPQLHITFHNHRQGASSSWYELDLATWFPGPKEGCVTWV